MKNSVKILMTVLVAAVVIGASWAIWRGSGGSGDDDEATITDLAGRKVAVELPVETVVLGDGDALGPFAAVAGENFTEYIIGGLGHFSQNYPDIYQAYVDAYPEIKDIPTVGALHDDTFNSEKVLSLQPDVLILPYSAVSMGTVPDLERFKEAGIPTVFVDFYVDPYGESQGKSVELIGKLLGQEERAAEIAEYYDQQVSTVIDRVPTTGEKPTVYFELNMYGPSMWGYTSASLGASSIDYAGGHNIAKDVMNGYGELDEAYILTSNPDLIVIGLHSAFGAAADGDKLGHGAHTTPEQLAAMAAPYLQRDAWSTLAAVQNDNVYFLYAGLALSIDNFAILQFTAQWLYPEVFADLDPIAALEEFYELYMPIELDGTWYYSIADMGA